MKFWDWKSIIPTIFIVGTLVFALYYCTDRTQNNVDRTDSKARAKFVSVSPITKMKQTKLGTNIYIESFLVGFEYSVDGVTYERSDHLQNIGRYQPLIDKISSLDLDSLDIMYDSNNPGDARIDLGKW